MLRRLYVHNFKTLMNLTFEPRGVSLLIGRNNVGKTNLAQALKFLRCSCVMTLGQALQTAAGGLASVANRYDNDPRVEVACECDLRLAETDYQFRYELRFDLSEPALDTPDSPSIVSEVLEVTGGDYGRAVLLATEGQQTRSLREPEWLEGDRDVSQAYTIGPSRTGASALGRLQDDSERALAYAFKSYLLSWHHYDLDSNSLRQTKCVADDVILTDSGSNLAAAVRALKTRDDRAYREVLELVRILEPDLDAINFLPSPSREHVFMVFEDKERRRFHPAELSSGTLRMLALAVIIASSRSHVYGSRRPPALHVVEEPDTGIFAGHLKELLRAFDTTGSAGQFIFTTHEPYFIDLFDGHLDCVFILERTGDRTVLKRPDVRKVTEWLGDFSLGELHFREMLGR